MSPLAGCGAHQPLQDPKIAPEDTRHQRLEQRESHGSEDAERWLKRLAPEEVGGIPDRRDEDLTFARHPAEVLDPEHLLDLPARDTDPVARGDPSDRYRCLGLDPDALALF